MCIRDRYWLLQGQWDRCPEQLEGSALRRGRAGQQVELRSPGGPDPVAGERAEVVEQLAKAADRLAVLVGLAGGLGARGRRPTSGSDRVRPRWRRLVGKGQRGQRGAQVPDQVAGQEADQHVRADPVLEAVVDGAPVSYTHLRAHETKAKLVCR